MILPVNSPSLSDVNRVLAKGILKQCRAETLDEAAREALAEPVDEPRGFLSRWFHTAKTVAMPKTLDESGVLRRVIWKLRGCSATHLISAPVVVRANGETVWEGTVEVFTVTGHPTEGRVFAWVHRWGDRLEDTRCVTMLQVGPVDSPKKAVEMYLESRDKG